MSVALAVLGASACAGNSVESGSPTQPTRPGTVDMIMQVQDVDGESRTFRFIAEIRGGPDNNPDLYCVATTWRFGDGPPLASSPGCAPWTPEVRIRRRFETVHAYEAPGSYETSLSYGPLASRPIVVVAR